MSDKLIRGNHGYMFAPKVSRKDIERLHARATSLQKKAKSIGEKAEETIGEIVATSEVGAGAFTCGLLNGRYKGFTVANVPIDMAGSLALHLGGFLLTGSEAAPHMHNFGDGFLGSWMTRVGVATGLRLKGGNLSGSASASTEGEPMGVRMRPPEDTPYADDDEVE